MITVCTIFFTIRDYISTQFIYAFLIILTADIISLQRIYPLKDSGYNFYVTLAVLLHNVAKQYVTTTDTTVCRYF